MELRPISVTDNELEVEVIGENETILNPLKVRLLLDDDVELAEYIIEHPFLSNPKIFMRTRKGDATKALTRALKALQKEYKDFEKAFEDAVPTEQKE